VIPAKVEQFRGGRQNAGKNEVNRYNEGQTSAKEARKGKGQANGPLAEQSKRRNKKETRSRGIWESNRIGMREGAEREGKQGGRVLSFDKP